MAVPVAAFRYFTPNEWFPVVHRRRRTAHVDVGGRRGDAIRLATRDQLGPTVLDIKPVGLESSAGSTPLRLRVEGGSEEYLFAKLYTKGHVRAGRGYKLWRTVLPELAKVGNPWRALESAQWAWVLVAVAFSALTYLASAAGLLGGVSVRVPFWPTVLTQGASSFVNRVPPSNVGGMALNVRFLQKSGVEPSAGVAAVGVNALAGALVHAVHLVIFLAWAGRSAGKAFKLPSSSPLLVVLGSPVRSSAS